METAQARLTRSPPAATQGAEEKGHPAQAQLEGQEDPAIIPGHVEGNL